MQCIRLTPTSYIVLGLLELAGESTPYGLKQLMARSVGYFWTLQHAQLYTEPARLADTQIPANEAQLTELEQIRDTLPDDVPEGPRQTLEMGMRFQRAMIAFWQQLAEGRPRRE